MRPAADLDDGAARTPEQFVVTSVGIALQITAEALEEPQRPVAAAVFRGVVDHTSFRDVGPDAAGAAMLALRILHRDRRVVGVHDLRRQHARSQQEGERRERVGGLGQPAAQRRARQLDALPGIALFLAVERQVIDALRDDDVGHQARRGLRLRQRLRRQLGDLQFIGLGVEAHHVLRPHGPADEETRRNIVELLAEFLADLRPRAADRQLLGVENVHHHDFAAEIRRQCSAAVAARLGRRWRFPGRFLDY